MPVPDHTDELNQHLVMGESRQLYIFLCAYNQGPFRTQKPETKNLIKIFFKKFNQLVRNAGSSYYRYRWEKQRNEVRAIKT